MTPEKVRTPLSLNEYSVVWSLSEWQATSWLQIDLPLTAKLPSRATIEPNRYTEPERRAPRRAG